MRLNRLFLVAFAATSFVGCGRPAQTFPQEGQPAAEPEATADPAPKSAADERVAAIFERYQQLPESERNTIQGDKLMAKIELQLGGISAPLRRRIEPTLEAHNKDLLQRALNDPRIDKEPEPEPVFTDTETAPVPRVLK